MNGIGTFLAAAGLAAIVAGNALAQGSSRPIRIIVPYGPGTGADITARLVAQHWTARSQVPVIVENRPGAGSIVGVNGLKQAPPDGTTIGVIVSANAAQPWLVKDLPYDIRKDFTPITLMYHGPLVMTVNAAFPAANLAELIAYAKGNPGKVFYGSLGVGTTTHLAAELLAQSAGIQIVNVPYKGSGDMHAAVAANNVQMSFDNYVSPKPLVDAGRLRPIVATGRERLAALPQVPTLAETFPGAEMRTDAMPACAPLRHWDLNQTISCRTGRRPSSVLRQTAGPGAFECRKCTGTRI